MLRTEKHIGYREEEEEEEEMSGGGKRRGGRRRGQAHGDETTAYGAPSSGGSVVPGGGPVGGAADAGHGVDLGEGVDLEGGAAHDALAVHPRHRLQPVHRVLEALEPPLAVEHAPHRERRVRLAAPSLHDLPLVADHHRPIRRDPPIQRHLPIRTQGGEDGAGLVVEDDEGEGAGEILDDLVGGVGAAVAEGAVGLDDEQRLVGGAAAQPVLPDQAAQVVQPPHEHAVDVIQPTEHPLVAREAIAGVAGDAGEGGAAAEGGGEGLDGVEGVEVPEDLVGVLGLRRAAPRAVQLRRRVRHLLLEYGQHFLLPLAS